jgi:hypothetical protein
MPQPIQNPALGQVLQRAFNLVGRVRPYLDEVIVPVVSLGELGEGSAPPVIRSAAAQYTLGGGGAGTFQVGRFEIPGNNIATIDRIAVTAAAQTYFLINHGSSITAPANTADKAYKDGRLLEVGETPAGVVTYENAAAVLGTLQERYLVDNLVQPGLVVPFPPGKTIVGSGRPGQFGFLEWGLLAANTAIRLTIHWTEYQLV